MAKPDQTKPTPKIHMSNDEYINLLMSMTNIYMCIYIYVYIYLNIFQIFLLTLCILCRMLKKKTKKKFARKRKVQIIGKKLGILFFFARVHLANLRLPILLPNDHVKMEPRHQRQS